MQEEFPNFKKIEFFDALENPCIFSNKTFHTGISIRPKPTILEKENVGIAIGIVLLLSPSILSVIGANYFADFVHPIIADLLREPIENLKNTAITIDGYSCWRLWVRFYGSVSFCLGSPRSYNIRIVTRYLQVNWIIGPNIIGNSSTSKENRSKRKGCNSNSNGIWL